MRRPLMLTNYFQCSRRWTIPRPLCLAGWQYHIVSCKLHVVFDLSQPYVIKIEWRLERRYHHRDYPSLAHHHLAMEWEASAASEED